jgi:hypothetical protein
MFSAQKFFDSEKNENKFLCPSPSIISSDPKSRKLHSHHLKMLGTGDDTGDDEMIVDDDKEENEDDVSKSTNAKLKPNNRLLEAEAQVKSRIPMSRRIHLKPNIAVLVRIWFRDFIRVIII